MSEAEVLRAAQSDGPLKWQARFLLMMDENERLEAVIARLRAQVKRLKKP